MSYGIKTNQVALSDITLPITAGDGVMVSFWGRIDTPGAVPWTHNYNLTPLLISSSNWYLDALVGNCQFNSDGTSALNTNMELHIVSGSDYWAGDFAFAGMTIGSDGRVWDELGGYFDYPLVETDLTGWQGGVLWIKANSDGSIDIHMWTQLKNEARPIVYNANLWGWNSRQYTLAALREIAIDNGVPSATANAWTPDRASNLILRLGSATSETFSHVKAKTQATQPTDAEARAFILNYAADTSCLTDLALTYGDLTDRSGHGLGASGTTTQGLLWATDDAAAMAETMTLTDSQSVKITTIGARTDSFALTESSSAIKTTSGAIAESFALTDAPSATVKWSVSISETIALSDSTSSTGSTTYSVTMAESFAITDGITSTAIFPVIASESFAIAETYSNGAIASVNVSESIALTDSRTSVMIAGVAVSESFGLTELSSSTAKFSVIVSDSVSITDSMGTAGNAGFGSICIGGVWKSVVSVNVLVGGQWHNVSSIKVLESGAWKAVLTST